MTFLNIAILFVFVCLGIVALSEEDLRYLRIPFLCLSWLLSGFVFSCIIIFIYDHDYPNGYWLFDALVFYFYMPSFILLFLGIRLIINAKHDNKPKKFLVISTIVVTLPIIIGCVFFLISFISGEVYMPTYIFEPKFHRIS